MSEIKVKTIEPSTGTNLTLGTSGDTIAVSSDSVKLDIWKDSGGNRLFQSDGSGTLSNVNSGLSGAGPKLILSQTPDASASVSFTSGINSTYDHYMFVFYGINPGTSGGNFQFQCSTDGGSNYNTTITSTFFRADHKQNNTSYGLGYQGSLDQAQGTSYQILMGAQDVVSSDGRNGSGILHLFSPASTTYVKQFYATCNHWDDINRSINSYIAGYFNTTSAINAISFLYSSSYTTTGTINMYGVA